MAEILDVSFCTINRLENGKNKPNFITEKKLEKLCLEKSIVIGEAND
jgi:DNA-binding XRE family transcriptional regulator